MYNIWYKYHNLPAEIIDEANTMKEAQFLFNEYMVAFAPDKNTSLYIKKVKNSHE